MGVKVKICGISNAADARAAEAAGADFVGLIFEPSSPRAVTLAEAAKIAGCLSGSAKAVGVFVSQTPEFMARAAEECGLSAIQLHGGISSECADLPDFSGCEIWRAVWLESPSDVGAAEAADAPQLSPIPVQGRLRAARGNSRIGGLPQCSRVKRGSFSRGESLPKTPPQQCAPSTRGRWTPTAWWRKIRAARI